MLDQNFSSFAPDPFPYAVEQGALSQMLLLCALPPCGLDAENLSAGCEVHCRPRERRW